MLHKKAKMYPKVIQKYHKRQLLKNSCVWRRGDAHLTRYNYWKIVTVCDTFVSRLRPSQTVANRKSQILEIKNYLFYFLGFAASRAKPCANYKKVEKLLYRNLRIRKSCVFSQISTPKFANKSEPANFDIENSYSPTFRVYFLYPTPRFLGTSSFLSYLIAR